MFVVSMSAVSALKLSAFYLLVSQEIYRKLFNLYFFLYMYNIDFIVDRVESFEWFIVVYVKMTVLAGFHEVCIVGGSPYC